jgi:L-asparagine transporter-like permease
MNEAILPHESKKFIKILLAVSLTWFVFGLLIHSKSEVQLVAFTQIFLFSILDLVFLLLLFWNLFFMDPNMKAQRINKIRIMLFGFFKLVCLAFLAITLKRLRNAPTSVHLMGVSIIWIGPLISGIYLKHFSRLKE